MLAFKPRMAYDSRARGDYGDYYITQRSSFEPYFVNYIPAREISGRRLGSFDELLDAQKVCNDYETILHGHTE